jgi:hypothetical protein
MKNEWKRIDAEILAGPIDYVRIEERLNGRLSVFVRALQDHASQQFEIEFKDYGALRVIGEHVPHCCGGPEQNGKFFEIVDSTWLVEVGLGPNTVYGGQTGHLHFVVFTASFTVDVASSRKPFVREVASLSAEELKQLTNGPTRP